MTRLREVRRARGLAATDVARRANLHSPNYYRLEAGKTKAGWSLRTRVAAALEVDESELFDRQGWPLPAGGDHE